MPARHDNVADPAIAEALLLARRGTAYFSRKVSELADEDYAGPSLLAGWSRSHVIAHVGYNARAIARLVESAHTGVETPMYPSPDARAVEIEFGATLSPLALRNLHDHSVVALNVEWRDLPAHRWTTPVRTATGREVPVSETVWMRTREVWLHAVDLDIGGSFDDFPADLLDRLLDDVRRTWAARGAAKDLVMRATDRSGQPAPGASADATTVVEATTANLVAWATGRQAEIAAVNGRRVTADRWL